MHAWPGVLQVTEKAGRQQIVTQEAETVLRAYRWPDQVEAVH